MNACRLLSVEYSRWKEWTSNASYCRPPVKTYSTGTRFLCGISIRLNIFNQPTPHHHQRRRPKREKNKDGKYFPFYSLVFSMSRTENCVLETSKRCNSFVLSYFIINIIFFVSFLLGYSFLFSARSLPVYYITVLHMCMIILIYFSFQGFPLFSFFILFYLHLCIFLLIDLSLMPPLVDAISGFCEWSPMRRVLHRIVVENRVKKPYQISHGFESMSRGIFFFMFVRPASNPTCFVCTRCDAHLNVLYVIRGIQLVWSTVCVAFSVTAQHGTGNLHLAMSLLHFSLFSLFLSLPPPSPILLSIDRRGTTRKHPPRGRQSESRAIWFRAVPNDSKFIF